MVTEPDDMGELVYFTRRNLDNDGFVMAWVYRGDCPKCKKGLMGKPRDEKTGKPKIRAKEYVCPECNYTVDKQEYEDTLTCETKYTCPECGEKGEAEVPFKRKKVQRKKPDGKKETVDVIRIECSKCGCKIDITKKLK